MDIYAYDKDFNLISVIDAYESFIWTERALGYGDFELVIPYQHANMEALVPNNFLAKQNTKVVMVIEGVRIVSDAETGIKVTVTGRSLESILERRIIMPRIDLGENKEIQNAILSIVSSNCGVGATSKRAMPLVTVQNPDLLEIKNEYEMSFEYDNVYEIVLNLCTTYGLMFFVTRNYTTNMFEFYLDAGEDRSYDQEFNPYVIFSPKFENLRGSDYALNYEGNVNSPIVDSVYQDQYGDTITYISDVSEASGLDRREAHFDGNSIESDDTRGNVMSFSSFKSRVDNYGQNEIAQNNVLEAFEGTIDTNAGPFIYGVDYFIGDIVQIVDEFGLTGKVKVSEVIQSSDANGEVTSITFEKYND